LEFDHVFLPGWEDGLFPNQRAVEEYGRAGLEEERRLAHVGLTRARRNIRIYFAANRRIQGMWNSTIPSRFIDELPESHVEVVDAPVSFAPSSRFDRMGPAYTSNYNTPGWHRAQAQQTQGFAQGGGFHSGTRRRASPRSIDGEVVARSDAAVSLKPADRVFHIKFGNGTVAAVNGTSITVDFDKAGRKTVIESFLKAL
jgi:DNA helicase-2/ATP-dependent DNA helicase PcrA